MPGPRLRHQALDQRLKRYFVIVMTVCVILPEGFPHGGIREDFPRVRRGELSWE
jgi:hypothetical protein